VVDRGGDGSVQACDTGDSDCWAIEVGADRFESRRRCYIGFNTGSRDDRPLDETRHPTLAEGARPAIRGESPNRCHGSIQPLDIEL
jgi:hypothetical protein